MDILAGIFTNKYVIIPAIIWLITGFIKVGVAYIFDRRIDLSRIVGTGGMPSSHTSYIVSLAVVIGKNSGWRSPEFGVAFAFALIVMSDAAGVRRAAGEQAKLLNSLMTTHFPGEEFSKKLKELLGHRPLEVIVGAVMGVILGMLLG